MSNYSIKSLLCVCVHLDVSGVQVSTDPEESTKGETGNAAAVCFEAVKGSDKIFGTSVEEKQHEDHVRHLPEGPPSTE